MKKFLTLALALVMALALAAPAMAFSTNAADDQTLEDYAFDFYLVEYEENDYFGGEDVIVTDLPESGRGYVTNEVVAAMIVAEVKEDAEPADDIDMYVTGENVKFLNTDEPAIASASVAKKAGDDYPLAADLPLIDGLTAADDGIYQFIFNPDVEFYAYDFVYDSDDEQWSVLMSDGLFEGYSNKDVTLRWLVFAKVTDDEASLTLTVELDGSAAQELVLVGDEAADLRGNVSIETDDEEFTVFGFNKNTWGYIYNDPALAGVADVADITFDTATDGFYMIASDADDEKLMLISFNEKYKSYAMIVVDDWNADDMWGNQPDATWYIVYEDGSLHEITAAGYDALPGDVPAKMAEAAYWMFALNTDAAVEAIIDVNGAADNKGMKTFVKDVCAALDLDPANVGNKVRPAYFGKAAAADETLEITIDIEPWQAFVTIPDVEVIDPPQTGDAATLAGFVMIVLAAAGVVVFKKVRA